MNKINIKKIIAFILCVCAIIPFVACADKPNNNDNSNDDTISGFEKTEEGKYILTVDITTESWLITPHVTVDPDSTWTLSLDPNGKQIIDKNKEVELKSNNTVCYVIVKAKNGDKKVYTLNIIKKALSKNYAENNTTIKIGMSGPLTGAAAIYGTAVRNAAQLAIDEINAAGGLNGIMFELLPYDDKHDPTLVATNYADMYEKGMNVSLGCVTTKPGLEFKELSKENNVFFITPSASGDNIPEYANGYQMCFSDYNQGSASAEYFNDNYAGKKIGVFYKADDDYSKGIYNKFKATLDSSKFNGELVEASFTGDASTFASQIKLLKDCDVIFMPTYYTPASQFMSQGVNRVKASAIYYGCDGLDGIDAVEGFDINTIPQEVSYLSHFNSNATSGPAKELIDKYNAKYDESKEPLNSFGAAAYDCVYAIFEALKVAIANGETVTANMHPSNMCEILKEVFNSDEFVFRGVTGNCEGNEKSYISWESNGYVKKKGFKYVVKEANNSYFY